MQYTGKQRKETDAKAWVVEQYHQSGLSPARFVSWFNDSNPPEDTISESKLFRWQKKYQGKDVAALIDRLGGHSRGKNALPDDAWELFRSLYLTQQERSIRLCYDITKLEYPDIPSYKAFERKKKKRYLSMLSCTIEKREKHLPMPFPTWSVANWISPPMISGSQTIIWWTFS